ncbi:3-hydroxyacyl-ACP dehydratase FabZ [Candidatus Binatia bacterium]|nr:3-hydroxyacyl-ACP dehydratase FabZ [Candidatus Binatia bacterium]
MAGPFRLVDRVIEVIPGERIVALKNVSLNEPYLAGHFPGMPIVPGVLICESLAQAGAILLERSAGASGPVELAGLDAVRFRRPVWPGDQIRLEVELQTRRGAVWKMRGRALVDGEVVADGVLRLRDA